MKRLEDLTFQDYANKIAAKRAYHRMLTKKYYQDNKEAVLAKQKKRYRENPMPRHLCTEIANQRRKQKKIDKTAVNS